MTMNANRPPAPPVKIADCRTPKQFVELVEDEHVRDLIALISMSQGLIGPDGRPEWAIRAAREFWRCWFGVSKSKASESDLSRLGYITGLSKHLSPQMLESERKVRDFLISGELLRLMHSYLETVSTSEAADFYAGLANGLRSPSSFAPSTPFMVYFVLAAKWREVSALNNTAQIHVWLEKILGPNLTGRRDRIAKLCQKIRLPLLDKGGRPKGKPRKRSPS